MREHSTCPSARRGREGRMVFSRGQMVKPFDDACFDAATPLGEAIGPVVTQFGAHLIWVHERFAAADGDGAGGADRAVAASSSSPSASSPAEGEGDGDDARVARLHQVRNSPFLLKFTYNNTTHTTTNTTTNI